MSATMNSADAIHMQQHQKMTRTQQWVSDTYGDDYHAVVLDPAILMSSTESQEFAATAFAGILHSAYGENYPYPVKESTRALAELRNGRLQAYVGIIARKGVTPEGIATDPSLLQGVIPAAITARLVDADGGQEAGRTCKTQDQAMAGFGGGILVLHALHDWHREGPDGSHVIYADVRASEPHVAPDGTHMPSGAQTQWLYIHEGGLRVTHFAPQYALGPAVEPFAFAKQYRNETWNELLDRFTVFTPAGEHTALLQAMCQHQTGRTLPRLVTVSDTNGAYTNLSPPEMHGPSIYAKAVFLPGANQGRTMNDVLRTFDKMGEEAPLVIVDIPAHTRAGAAAQTKLLAAGFVMCGFEPAHKIVDDSGTIQIVPPKVTMARLGTSVRTGILPMVDPYFPPGLYSPQLQHELERVHARFKAGIIAPEESRATL